MSPQFPIYIVSKGRWEHPRTAKHLTAMGVPFYIVVEAQERDVYAAVIPPKQVLVLDPAYQEQYDTCDDLGATKSRGPGPARNFAWDHAIGLGAAWHWVMDDNINGFFRLNQNLKVPVSDGTVLACMEDFCLRYSNIAMAGPNYFKFAARKSVMPPFVLNTRIYSCNLIRNDLPFRWRARYNEDTDICVRVLKAGWCTVQFNAFLQDKNTTQQIKGGNTAEFYAREGTYPKSLMQVKLHPDVSRIAQRFGRWHHYVDYRRFNQRLALREGVEIPKGVDDRGMRLVQIRAKTRA